MSLNKKEIPNAIQNDGLQSEKKSETVFSFNELTRIIGHQTLKSITWFAIVLFSVGLLNIILFIIALFRYGNEPLNGTKYGLFFMFFIGLISIVLALYSTYRYLLIDTLHVAYKYLTPLFKRICLKVIDMVISGTNRLTGKHDIEKMLNIGSLMFEVYGNESPVYLQKSVMFILKRIPFSDFLLKIQDDLKSGKKDGEELSKMLYSQLDSYIINTFFRNNSMKWLAWLLPLNIIIQIILLLYFK